MNWEALERWIWRKWKENKTLPTIVKEVSKRTYWSGYYSLCFIVNYLHNRKGIGLSRRQLRYAFSKVKDDITPGEEKETWRWILNLGGFKFERGKKSSQGDVRNTPILSYSRPKIVSDEFSPFDRYNSSPEEEKASQIENLA